MDKLLATTDDFDSIHGAMHKLREGSKDVKVPADALFRVMQDQATLLTLNKGRYL